MIRQTFFTHTRQLLNFCRKKWEKKYKTDLMTRIPVYKDFESGTVRDRHSSLSRGSPQPPLPFFSFTTLLPIKFFTRRLEGNKVPAFLPDAKLASAFCKVDVSVEQLAFLWWTPLEKEETNLNFTSSMKDR